MEPLEKPIFKTYDNKFLNEKEGQKVFDIPTGVDNILEEVIVQNSKLISRRSFRKDHIAANDIEKEQKIANLDDLYENDLKIGDNVNLLQANPDSNTKGRGQKTLNLEYCRMTLDDMVKRQLDQPFDIDFIIVMAA